MNYYHEEQKGNLTTIIHLQFSYFSFYSIGLWSYKIDKSHDIINNVSFNYSHLHMIWLCITLNWSYWYTFLIQLLFCNFDPRSTPQRSASPWSPTQGSAPTGWRRRWAISLFVYCSFFPYLFFVIRFLYFNFLIFFF